MLARSTKIHTLRCMWNLYQAKRDIRRALSMAWAMVWRSLVKYDETDGEQRAASFAYYAFFSLFPLILLLIAIGSVVLGGQPHTATDLVVAFIGKYFPLSGGSADFLVGTIQGVVNSHKKAGVIAMLVLVWSSVRFFQSLVRGVNRAWGTREYSWWRLPLQNMLVVLVLAVTLFVGIFAPAIIDLISYYYRNTSEKIGLHIAFMEHLFVWSKTMTPGLILFYGISVFYRVAPRRRTTFREVYPAAALVTASMYGLQRLFYLYATNITDFNGLYGALGSVVALLLWIYLAGSIIIWGGCFAAAQWEVLMHMSDQSERSTAQYK